MARRTADSYEIYINYGYGDGYEHEITEWSLHDAIECKKTYRQNGFPDVRIKKRRVEIADLEPGCFNDITAAKRRQREARMNRSATS